MDVTVLTASLPERRELLAENRESVTAQTWPVAHLVGIDHKREDAPTIYNRLLKRVRTEWVTFLDDDDLMDPEHIETMVRSVKDDQEVDVVYTRPRVIGRKFNNYFRPFSAELLDSSSIVPITALARTEVIRKAGGFENEPFYDWNLWRRLSTAGARFRSIDAETWTYRLNHGLGNRSWGEL